jgi:hypothetical protein
MHDRLGLARSIYRQMVAAYPGKLVTLRDRARVLARTISRQRMSVKRALNNA